MTSLQEQARALGDPTRHAVFRLVADAPAPLGVAEITEHFGLNHNAIRQHLAKLVAAGLVVEARAATGRPGRPRLTYTLDPTADSRWGVVGAYERLSLLLTEIIRTGDAPVEVGRRQGRREAAARGLGSDAEEALAAVRDLTARQGFDPVLHRTGDEVGIELQACPFAASAVADPGTVCALHLGIAQGMTEGADDLEVGELVARDPRHAACLLRLHIERH